MLDGHANNSMKRKDLIFLELNYNPPHDTKASCLMTARRQLEIKQRLQRWFD